MEHLNTRKVIKTMPDPRILRIEQIEEALDHPERLNETEWQELTREMLEIDRDLKDNPPSDVEFGSAEWFERVPEVKP